MKRKGCNTADRHLLKIINKNTSIRIIGENMQKTGLLITFEGLDFSGKSTQLELFYKYLLNQGIAAKIFREPGGTPLAEEIRTLLLHKKEYVMSKETEFSLFLAARSDLYANAILPLVEQGTFCLTDRCGDSSTAYQGFGRNYGDKKEVEYILESNKKAMHGKQIDITYFVDVPVSIAMARKQEKINVGKSPDRMESNNNEFFERTREGYLWLSKREERFSVIDGTKSIEEVHKMIINDYHATIQSKILKV